NTPFLTITKVEVMPDLRNASVWISSMELDPEKEEDEKRIRKLEDALNRAAGYLRHQLVQSLNTKVTPALHFRFDRGFCNTMRVNTLLAKI
ncbi:MAG TPA: ribosome-binding factor A, partial [Oligoflexia bacterium]|nr:ribosome-binding factor A [Oligoflexia bacterium]